MNFFGFTKFREFSLHVVQECIPVGCVPSTAVAVHGKECLPQCMLGYTTPRCGPGGPLGVGLKTPLGVGLETPPQYEPGDPPGYGRGDCSGKTPQLHLWMWAWRPPPPCKACWVTTYKTCWDTTCNTCWDTTPTCRVNRIIETRF